MLQSLVDHLFVTRSLGIILPDGQQFGVGPGVPEMTVEVVDRGTLARLVSNPELALGEAYMRGGVQLHGGDIYALLQLIASQRALSPPPAKLNAVQRLKRSAEQVNDRLHARENVHHHYDLTVDFYRLFLDEDLQYSCAFFEHEQASLAEAQAAKKRRIMDKLLIQPGMRALDIGCGWGGLGLTLAKHGALVTGVTLSTEQQATANLRAMAAGLEDKAEFRLQDYRDLTQTYDRIVSVGMFEHVGVPNYQDYFDTVARLLADDGVALIHSIGRRTPASRTQPWVRKYIFPGGYIPALSEVLPAIERSGLWITDVEILRLHYARTLRLWRERFLARRDEALAMYDEQFCRMWEFYLAASEVAFSEMGHMVFQLQLAKKQTAVPFSRDYLCQPKAG